MLEIEKPADMAEWVGKKLGTSEWYTVDQRTIDLFAEATGDHQWIHLDAEHGEALAQRIGRDVHANSAASATPGSGARMKASPTRKAWTPAARRV